MPLFPLLECLSPTKILDLIALLLAERQVVFISHQLSLLTACAHGATSLLYPLVWPHAFIPILPRQLVGVLEAPNPFICGLPAAYLSYCSVQAETARINLDEGTLDSGAEGAPIALPESLRKRLLKNIAAWGPSHERRPPSWKTQRLPLFDDAFCVTTDRSSRQLAVPTRAGWREGANFVFVGTLRTASLAVPQGQREMVQERRLRAGFLNLFISLLHNYRKHLSTSANGSASASAGNGLPFRVSEFLKEHAPSWRPLLANLVAGQAFSQFVDERVLPVARSPEVVFFDEAIDARERATRDRLAKAGGGGTGAGGGSPRGSPRDTEVLELPLSALSALSKERTARTYVPPPPDSAGLGHASPAVSGDSDTHAALFSYPCFPRLSAALFSSPRNLAASLVAEHRAAAVLAPLKHVAPPDLARAASGSVVSDLSAVYSCFIVALTQFVATSARSRVSGPSQRAGLTTNQVIADYAPLAMALPPAPTQDAAALPPAPQPEPDYRVRVSGTAAAAASVSSALIVDDLEHDRDRDSDHEKERDGDRDRPMLELLAEAEGECDPLDLSALSIAASALDASTLSRDIDAETEAEAEAEAEIKAVGERKGERNAGQAGGASVPMAASRAAVAATEATPTAGLATAAVAAAAAAAAAARLGLRVAIEALNCQLRQDLVPCDASLRCLADACSACGEGAAAVDLLALMHELGAQPDRAVLEAAAAALGGTAGSEASSGAGSSTGRVAPSEVFGTTDFRALQRRRGPEATSTLLNRRTKSFAVPTDSAAGAASTARTASGAITKAAANSAAAGAKGGNAAVQPLSQPQGMSLLPPDTGSPSRATTGSASANGGGRSPVKKQGAASAKLSRQFAVAEALLERTFPALSVDLAHPMGTQCPGRPRAPCPAQRPLTLAEVARGWTPGDSNAYTTRCVHCSTVFVPRFAVTCAAPGWEGSEGPATPLWCEMLSPWTLRKEFLGVLLADERGVGALAGPEARDAHKPQTAVVFWNALLAFRARGLPYTFLLTDSDVATAFPPNTGSVSGAASTPTK